ncbi:hypothetical protein GN244_ATG12022 [Phytophthora infestans]|uniref:Ankyrin repeat protein n=1 Tax=Phytophthora infestans TaxID=4787 RepID=A0A833SMK7_PHYIN|nr:hypothetical protein GN244_ATG12022 [Phytophthora infestans]KAF4138096.1 hypothetical protein GN958_ATG12705 [Phytophthora infestans]
MLMTPEEALIKAAGTNQLHWIEHLLDRFDGDLVDAIASAAANGHVDMIIRLVHEIGERENLADSERDTSEDEGEAVAQRTAVKTRRALRNAVQAAATHGWVNAVSMFLSQIVGSSTNEEVLGEIHEATWQVLENAAEKGRLAVVKFVVDYEWGYIEMYAATNGDFDALTRAITCYHDYIATCLLQICSVQWNMNTAYEAAIESQRSELVEWIYALSSQSGDETD